MNSYLQFVCHVRGGGDRLVAAGKRCVQTDHTALARAHMSLALFEAATSSLGHRRKGRYLLVQRSVVGPTVGGAVTGSYSHADLAARSIDGVERAFDCIWRLMMVDDARGAGECSLECPEFRRPVDRLEVECCVETPPHQLQHVWKVGCHTARCGHAAGECRVQVVMGVDQPRRNAVTLEVSRGGGVHSSSFPPRRIGSDVRH